MIRLRTDYHPGDPIASVSAAERNQANRWLQNIQCRDGDVYYHDDKVVIVPATRGMSARAYINFAFRVDKTDDLKYTIQPGAVEIEPDSVIEWTSIKDGDGFAASINHEIPVDNTEWHLWINVIPKTVTIDGTTHLQGAVLLEGAAITALTSPERAYTIQRRIAQFVIADDNITALKNLQCGDVDTSSTADGSGGSGGGGMSDGGFDPRPPGHGNPTTSQLGHIYAFEAFANSALTGIDMEPGDVMFEPGDNGVSPSEWVNWADITNASTTPAVSSTDVCVWLLIDVTALTATMMKGSESAMKGYIAGLSDADKKHTTMRPLVKTEWQTVGSVTTIKRVKNLQCGDVIISRL